jgi:deoxyxylulose-5-phosphate synthase
VVDRARALGVKAITVDGNNVMSVDDAAQSAVAAVRRGDGPHLLHVRTYRITGHTSTDAAAWRPAEEVQEARSRDPIARLGAVLCERGVPATDLGKMLDEAKAEMTAGAQGRERGGVAGGFGRVRGRAGYGGGGVVEVTLIEASRRAALQEMRRDERVWVLGEDVARGGLWGQYKDFLGEFGEQRVVSTPISESTIMGAGLGSALVGMRPIIEMRIFDFVMCAMDELVNQIAKIRYMFGGQAKPAVVVRMPHGMWRNSAAQHSQMLEAWFAHLPGVVVVTPSTAADTAGLLVQAIRSDDPVLFFDPKDLFGVPGNIPTRSSRFRSASRAR